MDSQPTFEPQAMTAVDSSTVSRELRTRIWPLLERMGFSEFRARTAWRNIPGQVHVVNVEPFSSYIADRVGCTTCSFSVNLGIYFLAIPEYLPVKKRHAGTFLPTEYQCHFRKHLLKSPDLESFQRRDIWYVDYEGELLPAALGDVLRALSKDGAEWFQHFSNPQNILHTLRHGEESDEGTFGFGIPVSPMRSFQTGYIALSQGRYGLAVERLTQALGSGCFDHVSKRLRADITSAASCS
jgi:hypothetical protein